MPPIAIHTPAMNALLRGFVDRVDIWEKDGKHYFRVVDYKTGKKDFDYCDVFNGVGLQMLLYLFALERGGAEIVGENPVAAGVQYFPARAPIVSADALLTDEAAEEARKSQWRRKGLLLNDLQVLEAMDPEQSGRLCCTVRKDGSLAGDLADPGQLRQLEEYIMRFLERMAQDVASGNIQANPYSRGTSHDACSYCPYGAVCHKVEVEGRRNYQAMSPQKFWEEVGKECSHGG
jgi:ATP-dependent helicase/nuclease subunit B